MTTALHIAFIDSSSAMRLRVAEIVAVQFPNGVCETFIPPNFLPDPAFDWSSFDAIVIGQFDTTSDGKIALAFARALALNTTRRPVVYLMAEGIETSLTASLKLIAAVKLSRDNFRDQDLITAILYARRDRGILMPANAASQPATPLDSAPEEAKPVVTSANVINLSLGTVDLLAARRIVLVDGSRGYRRLISSYLRSKWPHFIVEEIDPFSQTMHGAGVAFGTTGDIIIMGGLGTYHEASATLKRLRARPECPPVVLLVARSLATDRDTLIAEGAAGVIFKDALSQRALCELISQLLYLTPRTANAKPQASTVTSTVAASYGAFNFVQEGERMSIGIEGYRCLATLASNLMAHVFYAERMRDRKRAVIKVSIVSPHSNLAAIDRFCQRSQFISSLQGKHVVRYLDVGVAGPWPYEVLEYLPAGDLRSRIKADTPTAWYAETLSQLSDALTTLHAGKLAHLDLKPENIFFRDGGEHSGLGGDLVLIDFNISTPFGGVAKSPFNAEVLGTPAYMSPEHGLGLAVDGRSDLYSAGVIFYEMLTGEKPYTAKNDAELLFRHIHDEIPLLPKKVRHFQSIIDRLMAKNANERYATGADLTVALQPFLRV